MAKSLTKSERVSILNEIFSDFGIPVTPKSALDTIIQEEFGPGKRSQITKLLSELEQNSDATTLAMCIGQELKKGTNDKQILAVSNVLSERLPGILEIIDTRKSVHKRALLLAELIAHFKTKLPKNFETERLHRMLEAAHKNLRQNLDARIIGNVVENAGVFCDIKELKRFGKVLHSCTPALIALDQKDFPLEQKINLSVVALRSLSSELRDSNMQKAASLIENVHWLAKVALPNLNDKATVEQALHSLGISLGTVSTKLLLAKSAEFGISQREMIQIIYSSSPANNIPTQDLELIDKTLQNQQHAAICGFLAKMARESKLPELEKISIAGICLASMRQTYFELKTNNSNAANFSEAMGTILLGAGSIAENETLIHLGQSILSGVSVYAGAMAVPGGAIVAVPLAVCSVMGKLFLDVPKNNPEKDNLNDALNGILNQIVLLQQQMRYEFAGVYNLLNRQHAEVMQALDMGFNNLTRVIRFNNWQVLSLMRLSDQKLMSIQNQINQEFSDLYLEYVHDPLEEVDYVAKYGGLDTPKLQISKHKLAMWLLYKSKHPKVNGANFAIDNLAALLVKISNGDQCLSLINRYINIIFAKDYPQDLPHIPTWLQAAHAYALIPANTRRSHFGVDELAVVADIVAIGKNMDSFIERLSIDQDMWQKLQEQLIQKHQELNARWCGLKMQMQQDYVQAINFQKKSISNTAWIADAAPMSLQLEQFTPISIDVSEIWHEEIAKHIPIEFYMAVKYGLGSWQINYVVEKEVNTFADLHINYGNNILPDHSRDVLFRIDVSFKPHDAPLQLLCSTYVAYDLHDASKRYEQYYSRKFKLRHNQYDWISIDGKANQVYGHGNTSTNKTINKDVLALVYKEWLMSAVPINDEQTLARVKQNPLFFRQNSQILAQSEATIVYEDQVMQQQLQLHTKICELMLQKRVEYANILQEDPVLRECIYKIDLFNTIAAVYMHLLNMPYAVDKKSERFKEILGSLQQPESLNLDLLMQLDTLFSVVPINFHIDAEYGQSEFMQKLHAAITRLELLRSNLKIQRLTIS